MPTRRAIADHHGLAVGVCWRCDHVTNRLERAHIVDRVYNGLDGPQNLALLCGPCHRQMPIIRPEDWEEGLRYVGLTRVREALAAGRLPVESPSWSAVETRRAQQDGRSGFEQLAELIETADPEVLAGALALLGVETDVYELRTESDAA